MPDSPTAADRIKRLIVENLHLDGLRAEMIDDQARLFGDGLGLDSIDILEMSLAISKAYGVQLRSDEPDNGTIYRSLRSLNAHIQARRAK